MRIANKVFLGHGLTLGLLTVAGLVGLVLMVGNRDRFYSEFDQLASVRRMTSEIRSDLYAGRWQVEKFLRQHNNQTVESVQGHFTNAQSNIEYLSSIRLSSGQFLEVDHFEKTVKEYLSSFAELEKTIRLRGFDENSGYRGSFRRAAHNLEQFMLVNDTSFLIPEIEMLGHHIKDLVSLSQVQNLGQAYLSEIEKLLPDIVSSVQASSINSFFKKELMGKLDLFVQSKNKFNPVLVTEDGIQDIVSCYKDLEALVRTQAFGNLREDYLNIRRREKDYLLRGDKKYVAMVKSLIAQTESALNVIPREQPFVDLRISQLREYQKNFDLLIAMDARISSSIKRLVVLSDEMNKQIEEFELFVESTTKKEVTVLMESADRTGFKLILLGSLTLIAAIWFAFRFSQGISRPLVLTSRMLKSLEDGDFSARLNLNRGDEIGDMANALDGFAETLEAAMTAVMCAIVDRDQARLNLDQELAQKNAILAGFDGYLYVCSPDLRIEFMNQKLIERTGRDATGEHCYKALHDVEDVCAWCPNVTLEPGIPYHWEIQSPKDDRWYSVVNNLIIFPGNQQRKLSMIRDITEHKAALQALQFSEQRYRQLFENTPVPMWIVDMQTLRYLDVNETAINLYGYSREEFLGMTIMDIRPTEDIGRLQQSIANAQRGAEDHGVWKHRCKDGRLLDVEIKLKDISVESGRFLRLVMANDITDKEILRRELDQSSRLAAIGELAAGVAHEINNPNGMILMNLSLLTDVHEDLEPILDNQYDEDPGFELGKLPYPIFRKKMPYLLKEMTAGGLRIKRIVEDLKGFARKEAIEDRTLLDLNEIAVAAVRLVSYQIGKATSNFSESYAEDLPKVLGSYNRLEQVVVNLLINATQAVENRDQSISLSTGFSKDKKCLVVKVEDSGKGIASENLDKIFDPFFTTRRNDGGTGLGLSLSRRIAEEYGGSLQVSSSLGSNTVICLSLPCIGEPFAAPL